MKQSRKNIRVGLIALTAVVVLAGGGWVAARQIKSPAQIAADTAPPTASLVTAQVQRQSLSTEVIVRGTGRFGTPQAISLPISGLKTSSQVISAIAKPDRVLGERSVAITVSGRPVFVLRGEQPMHRDLGPGSSGQDVRQLERALARFGYAPGAIDGRYDGATAAAVAQMYRAADAAPFGPTEAQTDRISTSAAAVAAATDQMLQMKLALATARRGATEAEVNQAQVDAASASEMLPPARAAIVAARTRAAEAQDLASIARRQASQGDPAALRELAAATGDVTAKQSALNDALAAEAEAQRAVRALPPDATAAEIQAARANARTAAARVPGARAEVGAAVASRGAAVKVVDGARDRARDDERKAARDLGAAQSDLRAARAALRTLQRKGGLALSRVRILRRPPSTLIERQTVAASSRELRRLRSELARLASRSGVQVPADEILFFANTPVRVDSVSAKRGGQVSGDLMTVSNTDLAIDSGLAPQDAKLVKAGLRVRIEDPETGIDLRGRVTRVADRPGTNSQLADPTKTAFEVKPSGADRRLVNTSVRLSIAITSTKGKVLTVPISALSVGADGQSRVQLDAGGGRTRLVAVTPGLSAAGNVEVEPKRRGSLKAGDRIVIGSGSSSAATAPTGSQAPATPPDAAEPTTSSPPADPPAAEAPNGAGAGGTRGP